MTWNWQLPEWSAGDPPPFRYDPARLTQAEAEMLRRGGEAIGAVRHLPDGDHTTLIVERLTAEALTTTAIEGEVLDRDSVQSSLRRQFGLTVDRRRAGPAEQGMAELATDLYQRFAEPLEEAALFRWHTLALAGSRGIEAIGTWRTHSDAMQIVSGPAPQPTLHFEAPPSARVRAEMARLIEWFNRTAPDGPSPLPMLARAGVAHLWFETVHPFEDGNGRIGRALAEKAIAQGLGRPSLIALSQTLEQRRRAYYDALAATNRTLDIDGWLGWFADRVLEAQAGALAWIDFLIAKARFLDGLRGKLTPRQEKVLLRMLAAGPEGFKGGLSAGNYQAITGAPAATARRDLSGLVGIGALTRTGAAKGTRYWLPITRAQADGPPRPGSPAGKNTQSI